VVTSPHPRPTANGVSSLVETDVAFAAVMIMPTEIETLTLTDAKSILAAGEAKAHELGPAVNIAVVDAGGHLIAHVRSRHDRTRHQQGVHGARVRHCDPGLGAFAQPGREAYGIQHSNGGRVVIFAGGVPIQRGAQVIGAVGVSGGVGEQDAIIADAAAAALADNRVPSGG
jgi:uncharacterized protein GlcG (DUF336 family)